MLRIVARPVGGSGQGEEGIFESDEEEGEGEGEGGAAGGCRG